MVAESDRYLMEYTREILRVIYNEVAQLEQKLRLSLQDAYILAGMPYGEDGFERWLEDSWEVEDMDGLN